MDPKDPFPLHTFSYSQAQDHSTQVDAWLGLRTEETEAQIQRQKFDSDQNVWQGLPVQALLTPYSEIREILARLKLSPNSRFVDLGAGYGRMAFVLQRHAPQCLWTGYELVKERVQEGQRCMKSHGLDPQSLIEADLADPQFRPATADFYFLYDFGTRAAIEKCLEDLRSIARDRGITVIGRGRASRHAIERSHPWLSQVVPPEHYAHYSIYRSTETARGLI